MKRLLVAAVASAALLVPTTAGASGVSCSSATHGATWKNPGAMFQAARDGYGVNPAQLAAIHGLSVGQFVAVACQP
jgi:hypothetical protein